MKKKRDIPLHVCRGCGSCFTAQKRLENLIKECVRDQERFKEGVYARPEVLAALENESHPKKDGKK